MGGGVVNEHRELLLRVADSLTDYDYATWDFGDSVAFEGMLAASAVLEDPRWSEFARGWFRAWESQRRPFQRRDCTAPGLAMLEAYRRTDDARVLAAAVRLARYLTDRPRLDSGLFATWESAPLMHPYGPGRLDAAGAWFVAAPPAGAFVDCLHFDPPFFVGLGLATGDDDLVATGLDQAVRYVAALQQPDGLFDHFHLADSATTYGPGWGRGQGWALLGMTDVLYLLGSAGRTSGAERHTLEIAVDALVTGMIKYQRADGHWGTDVRVPDSGEEHSTAAFMAVGFRRAARLGLVDAANRDTVDAAADSAYAATLDVVDTDGTLTGVSAAVLACTEPSHYVHVPTGFRVPWGQGPLALMLSEFEELP